MRNAIIPLAVGIAIGYFVGFKDARTHADDVIHRMVEHVAGTTRDRDANDVDAMMRRLEKD